MLDSSTFDARYPELFADLQRVCRALGAGCDAEDIAQETLLTGRSRLPELRDETKLKPWLRRIAIRSTLRSAEVRQRRGRRAVADDVTETLPGDWDFASVEVAADERAALRALPRRQRQYVALVYFAGYRQEEVAEMLDVSRGTVARTIWEARASLAHSLADYQGGAR